MIRRIFSVIIVVTMMISCNMVTFATVNSDSTIQPIVNEGEDIVLKYDDHGIYDMIQNIDDSVKKTMIINYWYTPAFYTTTALDMENQKLDEGRAIIEQLIKMPTEELPVAIDKLLQADIDRLAKNSNVKIVPSFIERIKGKSFNNVDVLEKKVGYETGVIAIVNDNANTISKISASTSSVVNSSTTASWSVGNSGGIGYLSIKCVVAYTRNTSTYDITSLTPTTTTGYFYPNYVGSGYVVNAQGITQGSTDRGYVHKSKSVWNIINGTANTYCSGYLVADIVVQGSGVNAKKYANELSVQTYENNYSWGY